MSETPQFHHNVFPQRHRWCSAPSQIVLDLSEDVFSRIQLRTVPSLRIWWIVDLIVSRWGRADPYEPDQNYPSRGYVPPHERWMMKNCSYVVHDYSQLIMVVTPLMQMARRAASSFSPLCWPPLESWRCPVVFPNVLRTYFTSVNFFPCRKRASSRNNTGVGLANTQKLLIHFSIDELGTDEQVLKVPSVSYLVLSFEIVIS